MEIQFYNIYLRVLCPDRHVILHGYFVSFLILAVMLYRITGAGPKTPFFHPTLHRMRNKNHYFLLFYVADFKTATPELDGKNSNSKTCI